MRPYGYPLSHPSVEKRPYRRNPMDYPSNDQELQTMLMKRIVIDPRQIRRLAKNAKQRLGLRLQ